MKRVFAYDRVWLSCSNRVQSTGLKIQILTNWLTPSRITAGLPCLKCCLWWSVGAILCTEHQTERHLINQTFNQWGILEPTLFFLFPSSIRCSPNDHFDYLILSVLCVFPCCRPSLLSHGHGTFSRHNSLSVCHGHGTFSRHNSLSACHGHQARQALASLHKRWLK